MDSLICVVYVQCEIGFVLGEQLMVKGYLLLVVFLILNLIECIGFGLFGQGVIMVIYIVLVDGDDIINDLVVDIVCVIFDGYFVLL